MRATPQRQRGIETREAILEASRKLLAKVGRDRFSTTLLTQEIDFSVGTIYRYFPDRVAILDEIEPILPHGVSAVLALHKEEIRYTPRGYEDTSFDSEAEAIGYADDIGQMSPEEREGARASLIVFSICTECTRIETSQSDEELVGIEAGLWPCRTIRALTGAMA